MFCFVLAFLFIVKKSERRKTVRDREKSHSRQSKQKMSHSSDETANTTTATTNITASTTATPTSQSSPSTKQQQHCPPLSVPLECDCLLQQQKQQQQEPKEPRQQAKCTKEKSNRHKILTKDGTARFGTIYNACPFPHKVTRPIQLTKCTAVRDIKKSAAAKKNKMKIARAGESVYVLGDPVSGSKGEVFVFKEGCGGCVYKRVWEAVKEDLRVCGDVVVTVSVEAEGVAGKEAEGRWLQVELGRSKEAEVWVSERWWDAKMRMRTMRNNNNSNSSKEIEKSEEELYCGGCEGDDGNDSTTMSEACRCSSYWEECGYVDVDDILQPF